MTQSPAQPVPVAAPDRGALAARRHWLAAAVEDAMARLGAKLGAGWVLLIAALAVFAPFIANSKPLVMKYNGAWSSPLLAHLGATDVVLLIVFFTAVAVVLLPIQRFTVRGAAVVWMLLASLPMTLWSMLADHHAEWARGSAGVIAASVVWSLLAALGAVLLIVPLTAPRSNPARTVMTLLGVALMAAITTSAGMAGAGAGTLAAVIGALLLIGGAWLASDASQPRPRVTLLVWGVVAPCVALSLPWTGVAVDQLQAIGPDLFYTLLVIAAVAILAALIAIPFAARFSVRGLVLLLASAGVLATVLAMYPVNPPEAVVHERERELAEQDRLDYVVWAPIAYSPNDRLRDQWELDHPLPPSWVQLFGADAGDQSAGAHLLGTDRYGSDILSKMIHATRIALAVGFIAESLSLVIGVIIGALMGYFAGLVDLLGLRLVEVFSAIPRLFLLLAAVAFFGRNIYLIMAIIGATGWTGYAYFVRAEFLRLRNQDFVKAAIATDTPLRSILFRHMLPNGMAPVLVNVGFGVASAILYESTLSFLGLGVIEQASWGELLDQAVSPGGGFYWWLASFPGLAIFATVFAFNLLGEAMRDAIDPKLQGSQQ